MTDSKSKPPMDELLEIMARLRGKGGCPWDRKQTHETLRPYVVEEAYELVEAIDGGVNEEVREELGDLLLQIVFHSQIASESSRFTFDDVARGINEKLIRRHPHVFGDASAADEDEALMNWERIKVETEGKRKTDRHRQTPILHRALRLQDKAVSFGFDWEETGQLLEKLEEEIGEVRDALQGGDREQVVDEVGDLFFMVVNLARFLEIHPEDALERSITKFSNRFRSMEKMVQEDGQSMEKMGLEEMERYWVEAKKKEKG
ncbi:MAG: nucleoside triphosphate pyrophosphohydrolase [bacterium]|nr:nucleoside triphosphate pyrophosphohydrolase [bacterium]